MNKDKGLLGSTKSLSSQKRHMKQVIAFLFLSTMLCAQPDSALVRSLYDAALSNGRAYADLQELCKSIGPRLSGSPQAQMAVEWGRMKMEQYGFDRVYLQEVEVPHWERGNPEAAWIKLSPGKVIQMDILALGGSIGTNGAIEAAVVRFDHIDKLKAAKRSDVQDKIVFLDQPMDEKMINTFKAYGGCYPIRGNGASEAAKLGAKAVIIRSLSLSDDDHPHTGSLNYDEEIPKIPAAALSTNHANLLTDYLKTNKSLHFILELDCRVYPPSKSYNVIGELKGKTDPEKIITVGGHLDSWDTGEGAHDDGAGIIHSLEALRILKTINYKPAHTLRVVFFMNEENGNMGGKTYAKLAKEQGEQHLAAVESDRGGFTPRGFSCDGTSEHVALIQTFAAMLQPYDLREFEKGYGGVDISPLKDFYPGIPLFGLVPDSQRYFDFHHAPSDVFENVNKRELELGAAALASFLYLLDQSL